MYSIPEIRLHRTADGWVAQFIGDAEAVRLFGAATIPTAFTAQAEAGMVLREIQLANPHHLVTLPV